MSVTRLGFLAVLAAGAVLATAAAQVPPPFRPAPNGLRAELSVPGPEGMDWRLRVYRRRGPGSIDYCLALAKGGRASGALCALSAEIALRVHGKGTWLDCGGLAFVLGEPAPPGPTCGLIRADATAVSVGAEGAPAQTAALSEPFALRVNRSERVLRGSDVDPRRVRRLPRPRRVRAFLAFVDGPATPPGRRTPRLTVTVADPSGVITRRVGGWRVPEGISPPLLPLPAPSAKRVRLAGRNADGRLMRTTSWKSRDGSLCVKLRDGRGRPLAGLICWGGPPLRRQLARDGSVGAIQVGPGARRPCCTASGFARGDAVAIQVVAPDGRTWPAKLSPAWTTLRHGIKVRAYLAVLPDDPALDDDGMQVRTTLRNGRVLTDEY